MLYDSVVGVLAILTLRSGNLRIGLLTRQLSLRQLQQQLAHGQVRIAQRATDLGQRSHQQLVVVRLHPQRTPDVARPVQLFVGFPRWLPLSGVPDQPFQVPAGRLKCLGDPHLVRFGRGDLRDGTGLGPAQHACAQCAVQIRQPDQLVPQRRQLTRLARCEPERLLSVLGQPGVTQLAEEQAPSHPRQAQGDVPHCISLVADTTADGPVQVLGLLPGWSVGQLRERVADLDTRFVGRIAPVHRHGESPVTASDQRGARRGGGSTPPDGRSVEDWGDRACRGCRFTRVQFRWGDVAPFVGPPDHTLSLSEINVLTSSASVAPRTSTRAGRPSGYVFASEISSRSS